MNEYGRIVKIANCAKIADIDNAVFSAVLACSTLTHSRQFAAKRLLPKPALQV